MNLGVFVLFAQRCGLAVGEIHPRLHRGIIGVRFVAQFLSNRTCNFSTEIDPGRDMASERREDAAARRFDGAKAKGSRPI